METAATVIIFLVLVIVIAVPYWVRAARHRRTARVSWEKNRKTGITQPVALHPHIDLKACIGCAGCVRICPEGVLGIIDGRASIIHGIKCIGHGLCADVCPVSGITLGFGKPGQGMEIPEYDADYQTNVRGLYTVGEVSGVGLIRNAVAHGVRAVGHLAARRRDRQAGTLDVIIVGAGPAGLTAALACQERSLTYVVLEQEDIGGSILHYPRQKLVLTSPVDLPLFGRLKASEISKEELLRVWHDIAGRFGLRIQTRKKVDSIEAGERGFLVRSGDAAFRSAFVVLAVGRRGSPRKLGVPGEELPKVMYRLEDAGAYAGKRVLVVGGGDSAVEAAIGLAGQRGTTVTLSYRREEFVRLKDKNEMRVKDLLSAGRLAALFNSEVREITRDAVMLRQSGKDIPDLANDYVFVFAGGALPTELLTGAGVRMRSHDVVTEAA